GGADVEELLRRILDGLHHLRVRVTGRRHGDARHEVEEAVPIDVVHPGPLAAVDDQGVLLDVARGAVAEVPRNDLLALGAARWTRGSRSDRGGTARAPRRGRRPGGTP